MGLRQRAPQFRAASVCRELRVAHYARSVQALRSIRHHRGRGAGEASRIFSARRKTRRANALPGARRALSNIPIRVPLYFLGRDDALAEIGKALERHAVTVVHGLRGAGKTTLAAAYAEKHRSDYRATWWIRAQTDSTMRADLVALGVRLNWVGADAKEEEAVAAVLEHLRSEGEGLLLIYGNAIDAASLRPYLPLGGEA